MSSKAAWSLITLEQFKQYTEQADRLCHFVSDKARELEYHPITGALAGIAMIRAVNQVMGGDLKFWGRLLLEGPMALDDFAVQLGKGAIPNVPRGRGTT